MFSLLLSCPIYTKQNTPWTTAVMLNFVVLIKSFLPTFLLSHLFYGTTNSCPLIPVIEKKITRELEHTPQLPHIVEL